MHQPSLAFDLAQVNSAIAGTEFAGCVLHFPSVASTNDLAQHAALAGARHGVWIADEQTAGRGRGAHAWHSPAGSGLYMTALVSPRLPMQSAVRLSLLTAIAVQSAICSTFGFTRREQIDIRWPNDLVVPQPGGPARKLGGILIDTASTSAAPPLPAMLRYAVIGIGINVNQSAFPPELETIATSLRRELTASGYPKASALGLSPTPREQGFSPWGDASAAASLRREPLAAAILVALDREIGALVASNPEPRALDLFSSWLTGKRVRVESREDAPGGYTGTTAGLDAQGFLLVQGDDGQLHTVLSGGLREP